MLVEYFCLLLVCGDGVIVVCEGGFVCCVIIAVFVVEAAYELG